MLHFLWKWLYVSSFTPGCHWQNPLPRNIIKVVVVSLKCGKLYFLVPKAIQQLIYRPEFLHLEIRHDTVEKCKVMLFHLYFPAFYARLADMKMSKYGVLEILNIPYTCGQPAIVLCLWLFVNLWRLATALRCPPHHQWIFSRFFRTYNITHSSSSSSTFHVIIYEHTCDNVLWP